MKCILHAFVGIALLFSVDTYAQIHLPGPHGIGYTSGAIPGTLDIKGSATFDSRSSIYITNNAQ